MSVRGFAAVIPTVLTMAAVVVLVPLQAGAQTPAPTGTARWSIELYGGSVWGSQSTSGAAIAEFPVGDTFSLEAPGTINSSRAHASWRFGDGALLFTQVAAQFSQIDGRAFATITPLDAVLRASGSRSGSHATVGLRVERALSSVLGVELLIERSSGGLAPSAAAITAITAANTSFENAFTDLLATAPVVGLQVTSAVTWPDASSDQWRVVGAVNRRLTHGERWSLTATVGAGVQLRGGDAAEVRMNGRYQFSLFGVSPMLERDDVVITFDEPETAVVGLLGLGALYDLTPSTAVRLGVRAHMTGNGATTTIRTAPHVNTGQPAGTLPSFTNPGVQFSNTAGLSSLRPSLASTLTTFTGSGLNRQVVVTLGLVKRF